MPSNNGGVRSVQRAFDVLSLLTEDRRTLTIREVVDETGLAKTTALRLLQTLERMGLLWATPKGFTAGPALWRWAHLARTAWELPPQTVTLMRELGARHRESVNLYVPRDVRRVCVARQESPQPLRHVVRVGDELPLWAGASSKVLLAGAPERLLVQVARSSPYGEAHVATLRTWAAQAARDGYAVSHGEREPGLSAVAVLVRGGGAAHGVDAAHGGGAGHGGGAWAGAAALTLSGPTVRFGADRVREFAADLREAAERMSRRGFDHPLT